MSRIPASTYRLQISPEFTLADAAELAGYLRDLGADWFYLSPLLASTSGSMHGYDVVDHSIVDASRGGAEGLDALAATARDHGLGVLVDIVPNHVGVSKPVESVWWWDVLTHGRDSAFAGHFDIDWEAGDGKLRIPVLGETLEEAAASGALRIEGGAEGSNESTPELRYWDHRFPLAPSSLDGAAGLDAGALDADALLAIVARQNYELMDWRRADTDLNYRRFFAVNELAALTVENRQVFDDSHVEIVRWVREGLVDGIRVDHPDGLRDPGGYLDDLAAATDDTYVLVEKILKHGESLPPFWKAAGTTGYDALAEIDRVLVDPAGRVALDKLDASLRRGGSVAWADLIHATKRGIADGILGSEVRRLVREHLAERGAGAGAGPDGAPGAEPEQLVDAMAELLACFPVYRSYLPFGAEHLDEAAEAALVRRPDLAAPIHELHAALGDPAHPVALRFQQTSGMVMAKGVEDTAFYRTSRLASLTEVGADPSEFSIGVDEFHGRQQTRLATFPASMTTLSTHDTKRGEDTRARITVISEIPDEWAAFIARRRERRALGDGALENLLWESIVGAWPREREALHGYAEKAARESGVSTSWNDPDETFESRLHALIDDLFDDAAVAADVEQIVERMRVAGYANGLAAKLIQLTAPGVPDVYQGSEGWERSLVDPDNRRPVDFGERRAQLAAIDAGALPLVDESGAAKLLVVSRALRLRRDRPELFERYTALPALGTAAAHVVGFDRGGAITIATRLPLGLDAAGGWGDTTVIVENSTFVDVLTGRIVPGGELAVAELLDTYPVALLTRLEED
ncbi:malto-oligosyltrehalose synthase [Schumannella sp. 10F1B-5-1]|uniref:malto-oligosyltrehalose synthase n=1 Tax=Schumannella sp. 10F1B-5-1 TaxID=2590780 RepID=UPI001131E0AF|nr:malto-oligosyltrehalose synthase [Schumannella sp. 10F1B-5-1]TPW76955.1 malto-oligosyltrehalose synthase [Schumannella sp. 10F1B-5-1]